MICHGGHAWSSFRYPWEETSQHWLSPKKPTDPERLSEKLSAAFEHNHKVLFTGESNVRRSMEYGWRMLEMFGEMHFGR